MTTAAAAAAGTRNGTEIPRRDGSVIGRVIGSSEAALSAVVEKLADASNSLQLTQPSRCVLSRIASSSDSSPSSCAETASRMRSHSKKRALIVIECDENCRRRLGIADDFLGQTGETRTARACYRMRAPGR